MKWVRETCGKRWMSFMVSSSGRSTSAVDHQFVLRRIDVGPPGMMAFEEQSVRRDDAVQVLQRRKAHGRFRARRQPGNVAPDDGGFGIGGPAIGPVDHAGADRLRPRRVRGGRRFRRRIGDGGSGAEGEAAGQRRAEAQKAASLQGGRAARSERIVLLRNGSGRMFSSPRGRIAALFLAFFEPVSTFANLVNAKEWPDR